MPQYLPTKSTIKPTEYLKDAVILGIALAVVFFAHDLSMVAWLVAVGRFRRRISYFLSQLPVEENISD